MKKKKIPSVTPPDWIGVDLDGTLAYYDEWRGPKHVGEPIKPIVNLVKRYLKEGWVVKILTARAHPLNPGQVDSVWAINDWCIRVFGHTLPITSQKDFGMRFCIDDRAVQVEPNTGRILGRLL